MKRSSVNKAIWSETREESYKRFCNQILFDKNLQLSFIEDRVYLKSDEEEILITNITKPKTTWYEVWKKLKSI